MGYTRARKTGDKRAEILDASAHFFRLIRPGVISIISDTKKSLSQSNMVSFSKLNTFRLHSLAARGPDVRRALK